MRLIAGSVVSFVYLGKTERDRTYDRVKRSMAPRILAAIIVLLLIGSLAIAGIGITSWLGPKLAHGTDVKNVEGRILTIESGRDFTFVTKAGQHMNFECRAQCRGSLAHMQRHVNEKANTDVYYIQGPGNTLQVIDVD